ncbi:MAG: fimbrillin family protein, partial [Muribaculaceae bacterium]|nr:fimbrillin family protein [Muribaculaceae bacterium]
MKNNRYYYRALLLLPAFMLFSCSPQDEEPLNVEGDGDLEIVFKVGLPGVETRSESFVTASLDDGFHVTAFCPDDETTINGSGNMQ